MRNRYIIHIGLTTFFLLTFLNLCSADDNRKGFFAGAGFGLGHTNFLSTNPLYPDYSTPGLAVNAGLGYAPTNRSALLFGFKSNVFVDEVADVYQDWRDKMSGDNFGATMAKIISPFVYSFAPLLRSHSIFGIVEYTHFLNETSPSFLFSGTIGGGFLYNKYNKQPVGGLGLSLGAGYEFSRKVAISCDLMYNSSEENIKAISVLISLKKYFY